MCKFTLYFSLAKTCTEGAMRLVNGVDDYSGRVELCVGGLWGTVCDEKFKTEDANSVCQQQGFKTTGEWLGATVI